MKIIEVADYTEMSRRVAAIVLSQLRDKPDSLLIFPTGETPRGLFRELASLRKSGTLDCVQMRVATLDEYAGLARDDRRRLTLWLDRELLTPLEITDDRVIAFDPATSGAEAECARVEREIANGGGIDLAIVGLGPNGHVGFNEPGSPFDSRARLVALAPESIRSNAAYWGSEAQVPPHGSHARSRHYTPKPAARAHGERTPQGRDSCAGHERSDRSGRSRHDSQASL